MNLSFDEINMIGQILDNTVGKGSTGDGVYGADGNASVAIRSSMSGNTLTVMAIAIKNLGLHAQQANEISSCENELDQRINKHIANLKSEFKKAAGRALKVKQDKDSISTRPAYVRRFISFELA
jgi:hypothetical protein